MRLKSLELQGFKSFPDKTTLTFGDGITAIVGPNGSGKSNISDAVRWVLGEQSTKTLRGSKMEDVIFGGTLKRSPVGYAEVSLTIDNSDGVLETEYNEVMVTRRYYRSGDSEFYINRKAVRLRDIHELFMDTGLGRDGYSIIGQGRIDEILSLKSEDRREVFEEAAGISKFRHRKEEAERKLDATEENLTRIRDIISELEMQVGPLEKQAEDARKYLRIHDELKTLEVDLWMHQLDKSRENLNKLKNDFQIASSQFERGKTSLEEMYNEIEVLSSKMREKDGEIEAMRAARFDKEREKNELLNEIALLQNTIENNLQNIERINEELNDEKNRAGGIENQINERREKVAELTKYCEELNSEILKISEDIRKALETSDSSGEKLSSLQSKKSELEGEISDKKIKKSAISAENEARVTRIAELKAQYGETEERLSRAKEERRELTKNKTEAEETVASADNVLAGVALKKKKREEKLTTATEAHSKLSGELYALERKLEVLRDLERDMEGFSGAVKRIHKYAEHGEIQGVHGTVAKLIKVDNKYTTAIETILGGALQNIVVDDEKSAKAGMNLLKRDNGGRATFMPISVVKGNTLTEKDMNKHEGFIGVASDLVSHDAKYKNVIDYLLGRIAVVDNINNASNFARAYSYKIRIVTLDGQVINAGGTYTGGSVSKNAGILSRANEIEEITAKISKDKVRLDELLNEKNEAERELNKLIFEAEVYENDKRAAEDILLRADTELNHCKLIIENGEDSIFNLENEINSEESKMSAQEKVIAELSDNIATLEASANEISYEIDKLLSENEGMRALRDEMNEKLSAKRESLASAQAEQNEMMRAIAELTKLAEELSGDNEQKRAIISDYEAKNDEIRAQIDAISEKAKSFDEKLLEIDKEIETLSAKKLELEACRNKKDKESKDKNDEILNLERERMRLEAKLQSTEGEEQIISDKLWENYELTIGAASEMRRPIENLSELNSRISTLKAERKKLGTVNLGAIEEYDRVSERYTFLSEQRDDLEKAKAELLEKISGITESMKEIFSEQFKVINDNFSETFTEIFGGGKAELSLDDPDNVLESGIEIRVQPPGKSLRTITLLSGGERAFVAIALYFAIMKVRPTPFCVLDEIEAALDDVNVVRYANYLRKLTKTTQFIVITHRRGTMEEADVLYGVTMQDAGISKMLTISIAEVEHELNMKLK